MSSSWKKIGSNHMFLLGLILFVLSIILFPITSDYTLSFILALLGLCLLLGAVIESIGERNEILEKKGHRSIWAFAKVFLNGITLALLILLFTILVYLAINSGPKALGLLMVAYIVVAAWIIERQIKRHG